MQLESGWLALKLCVLASAVAVHKLTHFATTVLSVSVKMTTAKNVKIRKKHYSKRIADEIG